MAAHWAIDKDRPKWCQTLDFTVFNLYDQEKKKKNSSRSIVWSIFGPIQVKSLDAHVSNVNENFILLIKDKKLKAQGHKEVKTIEIWLQLKEGKVD